MTDLSDAKKITRTGVQECVTGRCSGGKDNGIDDVGQAFDSGFPHGDNPWRLGTTLEIVVGKIFMVRVDAHPDEERSEDVEE